jgi:hypothetical protein
MSASASEMWWHGVLIPKYDWIEKIKHATPEEMLMCHRCNKPFIKLNEYEWKPACEHCGNIIVCRGGE